MIPIYIETHELVPLWLLSCCGFPIGGEISEDHQMNIPAKLCSYLPTGFRKED